MSVKLFVNNNQIWTAFCDYVQEKYIDTAYKQLKQESDEKKIFRLQGEIRAYERMLKLRDAVNGSKE